MRHETRDTRHETSNLKFVAGRLSQLACCGFLVCGLLSAVCCTLLYPANLFAHEWQGFGPFPTRNQNPVYLQNLSLTPSKATVIPEGTFEIRADSSYSSVFERGTQGLNTLDLDMEVWRIAPVLTYGIYDGMEVGLEVPFIHFSGGFLDGFIQKFHKFFGFPNAEREALPEGRFKYLFTGDGTTRFDYPPSDMGLSDVVLHFKHQLTGEDFDVPALAWFFDFKIPTGKSSRGYGSGAPDFGLGVALETSHRRLHFYFNGEYIVVGGNDSFANYMNGQMFTYMAGVEVSLGRSVSVLAQLDGGTPLLKGTGIDDWDGIPLDLVIGFKGEEQKLVANEDFIWQVGFSEDVTAKGPSVDFTFFVSLGLRFDLFGRTRPAGDWLARK